uniref:Putative ovule protein n=1 Tax=Solanum chacoense TaxID=4108 RepID=A0A0V0INB1_SOLCH
MRHCKKRGSIIASRCLLCNEALEINKHLFMHCKVTTQVWAIFTSIAGINWIMPEHTADLAVGSEEEEAKARKDGGR